MHLSVEDGASDAKNEWSWIISTARTFLAPIARGYLKASRIREKQEINSTVFHIRCYIFASNIIRGTCLVATLGHLTGGCWQWAHRIVLCHLRHNMLLYVNSRTLWARLRQQFFVPGLFFFFRLATNCVKKKGAIKNICVCRLQIHALATLPHYLGIYLCGHYDIAQAFVCTPLYH